MVTYVIQGILKEEEDRMVRRSFLIKGNEIAYVNGRLDKLTFIRMNGDQFYMAPGRVMNNDELETNLSISSFKKTLTSMIEKGCTSVVYFASANYERQLPFVIKQAYHRMNNSFIDYVIGLSLPAHLLRPSVLRFCKKEKIPVLRFSLQSIDDLYDVPWSRLQDVLYSYPIVLLPNMNELLEGERKLAEDLWVSLCEAHRIYGTTHPPNSLEAWPKTLLKLVGLYPKKGELRVGGDADYLLYYVARTNATLAETCDLDYDRDKPNVVVLRGSVLKANEVTSIRPGGGRRIRITRPGQFIPVSEASHWGM